MVNIDVKKTCDITFEAVHIVDSDYMYYQTDVRDVKLDVLRDVEQALYDACNYQVETKVKAFYGNTNNLTVRALEKFIVIYNDAALVDEYYYITYDEAERLIEHIHAVCTKENIS